MITAWMATLMDRAGGSTMATVLSDDSGAATKREAAAGAGRRRW